MKICDLWLGMILWYSNSSFFNEKNNEIVLDASNYPIKWKKRQLVQLDEMINETLNISHYDSIVPIMMFLKKHGLSSRQFNTSSIISEMGQILTFFIPKNIVKVLFLLMLSRKSNSFFLYLKSIKTKTKHI